MRGAAQTANENRTINKVMTGMIGDFFMSFSLGYCIAVLGILKDSVDFGQVKVQRNSPQRASRDFTAEGAEERRGIFI